MSQRKYAIVSAVIFAVAAVLQLGRALLGWPASVETAWGVFAIPAWPSWLAAAVFAVLAWLGFTAEPERTRSWPMSTHG